jgi:hypothetical protein
MSPRARTVRLLPDPEQHTVLVSTLQRVNRASNAARTAALEQGATSGNALRDVVRDELERFKLPTGFATPAFRRVETSISGPPGRRQRFSENQSVVFPASSLRWPSSDRVVMPTAAGRRTIRVYLDPSGDGGLRPPLEGVDAALVFRNGEFELVADEPDDSGEPDE